MQQLASKREQVKLLDLAGSLADTPVEKHIEFQPALAAEPDKRRDIQRFEKRHHGVWRVHPERIRLSAGCRFRVDHSRFHSSRSNPVSAGKPSADRADGDKHGDPSAFLYPSSYGTPLSALLDPCAVIALLHVVSKRM